LSRLNARRKHLSCGLTGIESMAILECPVRLDLNIQNLIPFGLRSIWIIPEIQASALDPLEGVGRLGTLHLRDLCQGCLSIAS
jgi:hypothetical protein